MTRPISKIYDEYRIPPWLAEHMLRVAAVAMTVFDAIHARDPKLEGRDDLIAACLLHDIGSIVKFNFVSMPARDGRNEYWLGVQKEMIEKYGASEHPAAEAICSELGVRERVAPILAHTADYEALILETEGTILQKIVAYADQRVSPRGVVSLQERISDMRKRYEHPDTEEIRALNAAIVRNEEWLFDRATIRPEDITEQSIQVLLQELRSFEI